ncbi:MAG: hypothetical protein EOM92_20125 [Gammaproteobacteria bacterium]|jgi:hypothetical protein|nr:hypothetical protein [Gammaproteobacteria bacterium]
MPTPNPYRQPRTRAEAIAPLEQVKQACEEDPGYLASVARIIADVLDQANSVAEPAPPGETAAARALRLGKNRVVQAQRRLMDQISTRSA